MFELDFLPPPQNLPSLAFPAWWVALSSIRSPILKSSFPTSPPTTNYQVLLILLYILNLPIYSLYFHGHHPSPSRRHLSPDCSWLRIGLPHLYLFNLFFMLNPVWWDVSDSLWTRDKAKLLQAAFQTFHNLLPNTSLALTLATHSPLLWYATTWSFSSVPFLCFSSLLLELLLLFLLWNHKSQVRDDDDLGLGGDNGCGKN